MISSIVWENLEELGHELAFLEKTYDGFAHSGSPMISYRVS